MSRFVRKSVKHLVVGIIVYSLHKVVSREGIKGMHVIAEEITTISITDMIAFSVDLLLLVRGAVILLLTIPCTL